MGHESPGLFDAVDPPETPEAPQPTEPDASILRAQVIVDEPLNVLDYRVPPDLVDRLHPGTPVRVP
ncbi:MAG: hypothetical protein AAF658_03010, partial [Myxococcota bacterium]